LYKSITEQCEPRELKAESVEVEFEIPEKKTLKSSKTCASLYTSVRELRKKERILGIP